MRTVRWPRPAVGIALMALAGACSGAAGVSVGEFDDVVVVRSSDGATVPGGEPIRIGGTLGLTGPFSDAAAGYMAAYDLWAANVNRAGGLLGRPVDLVIYDDHSDAATAESLYQRLLGQDQVDLLLAPDAVTIDAVLALAAVNETVLFAGAPVPTDLLRRSRWTVGAATYLAPDHVRGVFEMTDGLPQHRRPERIGIATARHPFTMSIRDGYDGGVLALARERGLAVVVDEEYKPGAGDVSSIIAQAQASDVDLFFALSLPGDAALLARTAHSAGFAPDIYCSCGAHVTSLPAWRDLGPAGDGIMSTTMTWPSDDHPDAEVLYDYARSELRRPEPPAHLTAGYAIMQVLGHAVEGVGRLDQRSLRDYVADRTIETVAGPVSYDEDGIPRQTTIVLQYRADHNEVVWPPRRATSQPLVPLRG